jgi:hypothetical protein
VEVEKLFRDVLPPDRVSDDEETRLLSASDIAFEAGCLPACVLRPRAEDEVAAVVRAARAEGVALHPRGGGWSYTAAYAPQSECSAVVDMKNVGGLAIDSERGTVTAGAGPPRRRPEGTGATRAKLRSHLRDRRPDRRDCCAGWRLLRCRRPRPGWPEQHRGGHVDRWARRAPSPDAGGSP